MQETNPSTNQQNNENIINQLIMKKKTKYRSLFAVHVNLNGCITNGYKLIKHFFKNGYGPDVICLSETHGNDKIPDLNTTKICYTQFFSSRLLNKSSGVGMYVNSSLRCKERKDLSEIILTNSVHQWVELTDDRGERIVVGVVYRHNDNAKNVQELCQVKKPKSFTQFWKDFTEIREKIKKEGKTYYVLGDFNKHLKNPENINFEFSENSKCKQLIMEPTHDDSLIDHIYTNDMENDNCVLVGVAKESKKPENKHSSIFEKPTQGKPLINHTNINGSNTDNFILAGVAKDLGKPVFGGKPVFSHSPIYCFIPLKTFYCNFESKVIIDLLNSIEFRFKSFEKGFFFGESKNFKEPLYPNTFSLLAIQISSLKDQFSAIKEKFKTLTDFFDKTENHPFKNNGKLMLEHFEEIEKSSNLILKQKQDEPEKAIKSFIHEISKLLDNMQISLLLKKLKSVYCFENKKDSESKDSKNEQNSESEDSKNDQDSESEDSKNEKDSESENLTKFKQQIVWKSLKRNECKPEHLKNYLRRISLKSKEKVSILKKKFENCKKENYNILNQYLPPNPNDKIELFEVLTIMETHPQINSISYEDLENFLLQLSPVKCPCVKTFLQKLKKLHDQLKIELVEVKTIFYIFVLETAYKFLEEL